MSGSKNIGVKIKKLREQRKLFQVDLAAMAGVSRSHISAIEQGLRNPSLGSLTKIAKALKVSISELV